MINGVDVSSYQPVDFSTSALSFSFIKATEGTGYVSPVQSGQAAHARAAGLVVGWYHFLQPGDMAAQAQYFVTQCASEPGDILAADWEVAGVSSADKDAFLRAVQALRPDHKVVLYCDTDFWIHRDASGYCADGLWIADITTEGRPRIQHPWTFHQYSSEGGVDRDVANFPTSAALKAWAADATPTPTPEANVSLTPADAKVVLTADGIIPAPVPPVAAADYATNKTWTLASSVAAANQAAREANANTKTLLTQVAALSAKVDALSAAVSGLTADGLVAQVAAELGKLSIALTVKEGS